MQSNQARQQNNQRLKPQSAIFFLLLVAFFTAFLVTLWAINTGDIKGVLAYLNLIQQNPPMWIEAPMGMSRFILFPTILLFILSLIITKLYPQPLGWARIAVIVILLGLTIRYLLWRSLSILNFNDRTNSIFSLLLFALELFTLFSSSLQLFLMLKVKNRQREADRASVAVANGNFNPTVAILIPSYDEPEFILRRTIIGCQAIEYEPKTIYLLDDTRRDNIKQLAAELGCEYLTRPNNDHAKAGNLNQAIPKTEGEFIVVFDADFVPTTNFLLRTLGFFQDETVALVQTPQSFYNTDPIARNLGLEDILTPEEEVFYRQIQPIKDGAGSVVCSGTSFVVRRTALEAIGGFVTDSLSEDYFTGIRLSAKGYRLLYLDEKLSAGLAAENISAHAIQRLRWARGTLQAFFINSNPLTIPGLNPLQRLAHLEGLLHWFTSIPNLIFFLMPLVYAFFGLIPIRATPEEIVYFFLPYYLTQLTVFSWLNYRSRSAILSGLYGLVLAFPLAITVIQVMLNPFSKGFKVTPKGTKSDRFNFNWKLALPLIILFVLTGLSLWTNICTCILAEINQSPELAAQYKGINLSWIWSIYNLFSIGAAILILLDVPKPDLHEWFNLKRVVKIRFLNNDQIYWGTTNCISEVGTYISLTIPLITKPLRGETIPVELSIMEEKINALGTITDTNIKWESPIIRIDFDSLNLLQRRKLTKLLFCRPGQWKIRETPGEIQSLWLLIRILLKPKILFERQAKINTIKVS